MSSHLLMRPTGQTIYSIETASAWYLTESWDELILTQSSAEAPNLNPNQPQPYVQ